VRYEDLVNNQKAVLEEIFKFVLETETLDGTLIRARIL